MYTRLSCRQLKLNVSVLRITVSAYDAINSSSTCRNNAIKPWPLHINGINNGERLWTQYNAYLWNPALQGSCSPLLCEPQTPCVNVLMSGHYPTGPATQRISVQLVYIKTQIQTNWGLVRASDRPWSLWHRPGVLLSRGPILEPLLIPATQPLPPLCMGITFNSDKIA